MSSNKILLLILTLFIQLTFIAKTQYQTNTSDIGTDYYLNPILAGNYPAPRILRDGDNYYIIHSSFEYNPGLLIWQSKDLINWSPVTNALHKYIGSTRAPDLVKHKNMWYIYFSVSDTKYVVTADSINEAWSEPINLKINSIASGHFVDENGHYNLGRQTLFEPVEWTRDGWFKTPNNIKNNMPIKKPYGLASNLTFILSDDFNGKSLKPQWKFFGEYDTNRYQLVD